MRKETGAAPCCAYSPFSLIGSMLVGGKKKKKEKEKNLVVLLELLLLLLPAIKDGIGKSAGNTVPKVTAG